MAPLATAEDLRAAFKLRPEPVCAITTCDEYGERIGMTATSVTSVSMTPPMVLVCVRTHALIASPMRARLPFVVHFLSDGQRDIAARLASPVEDKFEGVSHRMSRSGAARLDRAIAVLECDTTDVHPAGDHIIVVGTVTKVDLGGPDDDPLLFRGGTFVTVATDHRPSR
ncbi:putative reductase [Patulibacter medicamentivorans]|uniref:Putative reductase n=1 Tax=Patulibacter medicamentivorans TaxID=1097667 RepID=H0E1X3_9ACTN|nr:flavin reductase family protein [Patulibacter medicamentivorans]EHN12323.1 putative reductase [Patulibacter medicamentivorans]